MATFIVFIDNGKSWDEYQAYIDNGVSWEPYDPNIDT